MQDMFDPQMKSIFDNHAKSMKRAFLVMCGVWVVIVSTVIATVGYVAFHFISKVW